MPVSAKAQDLDKQPFFAQLDACYYGAEAHQGRVACKGIVAAACMNEVDGGQTTLGMSMCTQMETEAWDRLLNAEYREAMAWAKASDLEEAEYFPEFAKRAEALRAAQRAWIAFRDAECGFEYAKFGSGSIRHLMGGSCFAEMTADRTIWLRDLREPL